MAGGGRRPRQSRGPVRRCPAGLVLGDNVMAERLARIAHATEPTVATGCCWATHSAPSVGTTRRSKVWRGGRPARRTAEHAEVAAAIAGVVAWRLGRPEDAQRVLHETERLTDPDALDLLTSHEALLASSAPPRRRPPSPSPGGAGPAGAVDQLAAAGPVGGGLRLGRHRRDRSGARDATRGDGGGPARAPRAWRSTTRWR